MKGDILQRRLTSNENSLPEGCVFYLPLNENTTKALTDQYSGNVVENGTVNNLAWDSSIGMYKFTGGNSLNSYCFRIKTGWNKNLFDSNGSYTVVAKCKLSTSTQKYASFVALKPSGSTNFNKSYSATQMFNLIGSNSSTNTNGYLADVGYYATIASSSSRSFVINDVETVNSAATGLNTQYIFASSTAYDGYLYFGGCFDNQWQYGITYYLSELMIFNRKLTPQEIFNITNFSYNFTGGYISSGQYYITIPHNQTSANINTELTIKADTYLGSETIKQTVQIPLREYNYSSPESGSSTWDENTSTSTDRTLTKYACINTYPSNTLYITVKIIQKCIPTVYSVDTNNEWEKVALPSTLSSSEYDGVYRSVSNYNVNSKAATLWITTTKLPFTIYIRSYGENNYDYVMASKLNATITNNTSYSDTSLVKAHTRGSSTSNTELSGYIKVDYTGLDVVGSDTGSYNICVIYRKDGSQHNNDDRGYVIIPKNQ